MVSLGFEAPFLSISAMLAQEAANAADVKLAGKEKIGAAYVTVVVSGDVAAVSAAIEAGKQAVGSLGKVIPRASLHVRMTAFRMAEGSGMVTD